MSVVFDTDVLIIGGGLVGASLVCALKDLPLRTTLLEAKAPEANETHDSFDDKTTALSLGSKHIYQTLGLWEAMQASATPIHQIHVSEANRFGVALIDKDEEAVEALGFTISNRVLGQTLWQPLLALQEQAGEHNTSLSVICPANLLDIETADDYAKVTFDQAGQTRTLTTRLVIACDGVMSKAREALGVPTQQRDYAQHAVVTQIKVSEPQANKAFERFIKDQALAVLPLGQNRYAVVIVAPTPEAKRLMALDDAEFLQSAQGLLGARLGDWQAVGQRTQYPLALRFTQTVQAKRALVLGNAAHTLHPIAAQGFNLGLRDVAVVAECIADLLHQNKLSELGSESLLARVEAWRKADQTHVRWFTDGLVRWFRHPSKMARATRRVAMWAVDTLPMVRKPLVTFATGQAGKQPKLMQGKSL